MRIGAQSPYLIRSDSLSYIAATVNMTQLFMCKPELSASNELHGVICGALSAMAQRHQKLGSLLQCLLSVM